LKLLADPTRRQIFLLIMGGEICNCELADALGLPQNLVSHHLRKLRQAGLVEEHRDPHDGRWSHCTVNVEALTAAWEGLEVAFHPSRAGERTPACQVRAKKPAPVNAGAEVTGARP
jgi:ArsR family transcriptional regulator